MQVFSSCPILLERISKCDGELFLLTNISYRKFCNDTKDLQNYLETGPGLRYRAQAWQRSRYGIMRCD